ncbi:MAG: cobalt transporter CbiM, partial [Deltaproteobacteria bacterium]|nr:cobalt transporter CbiM [Deltaproteobacteria bacterium]
MHISEGVLSVPVLLGGAGLAVPGLIAGLRKLDMERLMAAALLASAFFVASLVHVPIGPGSVHLILNGLLGLLLGWATFPVIFIALLLQAVLFQFGGMAALGVNTFNMALPAVLFAWIFSPLLSKGRVLRLSGAFLSGALSVAGAGFLTAAALGLSDEGFMLSARLLWAAHVPVMLAEGCITALSISFMDKVRPDI